MVSVQEPVFCLTVPKSGTHLLANILRAAVGEDGVASGLIHEDTIARSGFHAQPKIYVGHVRYSLEVSARIAGHQKILLCRDPRDVMLSYADFLYNRQAPDALNQFVQANTVPPDEVLGLMIMGGQLLNTIYPDCGSLYSTYLLQWLPQASLLVRYEDLLPSGDDWSGPVTAMRRMLEVIGSDLGEDEIHAALIAGSDPGKSATFHRGRAGRWREAFTPAHVMQFKSVAPNLVSLLGYERDEQWGCGESQDTRPVSRPVPQLAVVMGAEMPVTTETAPAPAAGGLAVTVAASAAGAVANGAFQRQLSREIERIRSLLKRMRNMNEQTHARMSFLQDRDLGFFCWTNDWLHSALNQIFWDHNAYLEFLQDERVHPSPEVARAEPEYPGASVLHRMLRPFLEKGHRAHVLDIGCSYGLQSIRLSSALSDFSSALRITAFDCGWPGKLTPFNFEINGHKERIGFEPLAITNHNRTSIVYGEYGFMENCRTVNRNVAGETFSYPCASTTIDSYVEAHEITDPLFCEIDIQGGEYHALLGAERVLREQCYGALVKFIPHALQPSVDPTHLLSVVPGDYRVFQVVEGWRFEEHEIPRAQFAQFTAQLWRAAPDWTYLLILFDRYYRALGE